MATKQEGATIFLTLPAVLAQKVDQEADRLSVNRQTVIRLALGLAIADGCLAILPDSKVRAAELKQPA